jgi:hypothetical protein
MDLQTVSSNTNVIFRITLSLESEQVACASELTED